MTYHTLVELFEQSVAEFGTRPALGTRQSDGSFAWTSYREFSKLVEHARGGLARRGVNKGDRVAIIADNRLEWAVLAFATYGLGAVLVPMYEAQRPEEWEFIIDDSESTIVVGASDVAVTALREIASRLASVAHVVGLSLAKDDRASFDHLLDEGAAHPTACNPVAPEELAAILYTSGTTGTPKGVCLTHDNLTSNVRGALQRFDFREGDCSLAFLPWAHSFGQTCELYSLLRAGAKLAINDQIPHLLENLPVVRPSVLVAVPRIFNRIYDGVNKQMADKPRLVRLLFERSVGIATKQRRGEQVSFAERAILSLGDRLVFSKVRARFGGRLRFVVSGSAALSPVVAEFIDALGIDVFEGYGLTETSPVISANYPGHRKIGSVGPPFPGVTVTIDKSETGDEVQGEVVVKGPNVMQGYFKRPEETAEVLLPDGSLRTGDMGYLDSDGFLYITGRIKEQYKLENGKYVVPSPLEEELKRSPFIANLMLYGLNRPYNVALVVLDVPSVERWAREQNLTVSDLTSAAEVHELILAELGKYSAKFKSYERPKQAALITEDFTTENNMLTPKMSLKRRHVLEKYAKLLDALY